MTLLDRYLLRRMVAALARTLLALVALYLIVDLLTHRRDNILKYDIPWQAVVEYYLAFSPSIVYRLAPLAVLVSALLVFGDAAQNNEVTAALAGGISLRRLVRMPVVVALALAIGLFVFDDTVGAKAARTAERIERDYFAGTSREGATGISWANLTGTWTVHIAKFNRTALTGEDAILYAIRPDGIDHIQVRRIYWDEAKRQWLMEDGFWYALSPDASRSLREPIRVTQLPAPIKEAPDALFALEQPSETKTTQELLSDIAQARSRRMPVDRALVDFHTKFSQPALSFVMIWLAVPFALRLRRGGLAISFGASVAVAIVYFVLYLAGVQLGYLGRLDPPVAAWLANAVFLVTGLILFWRTPT